MPSNCISAGHLESGVFMVMFVLRKCLYQVLGTMSDSLGINGCSFRFKMFYTRTGNVSNSITHRCHGT